MKNKNKFILDPKKSPYFQKLDLVSKKGFPKKSMESKYHQVQQSIIYLDQSIQKSHINKDNEIKVLDMGSGKGYLTFAIYDYLNNYSNFTSYVTGVDTNKKLIDKNTKLARLLGYDKLEFINSSILDYENENADIVVALHACDSATDHTIYQAIGSNSKIILVAPCCHNQIFTQIERSDVLYQMLKYSNMREKFSQILTDTLRALYLEKHNYDVQVFKFVPDPHTPMNSMIRAIKRKDTISQVTISKKQKQISQLLENNNIANFELDKLLNS